MDVRGVRLTRKDGAPGVDGVTANEYEAKLEANLTDLLARIKSGRYVAPPVRRHYIPKADGTRRPLGIPTLEDKVAQRAILLLRDRSTKRRSCRARSASGPAARPMTPFARCEGLYGAGSAMVVDVDISKYFDTIDHAHPRKFLDQRVTDGVVRKMIDKWLKAGALEKGILTHQWRHATRRRDLAAALEHLPALCADEWFETTAEPKLKGRCQLVRYADDAVMAFEDFQSGKRMLAVLGKRLERFGLTLHPTKTRFVDFRFKRPQGQHLAANGTTFDFLGFTHVWGKS